MQLNTDRVVKVELYNKSDVFLGITRTFEFLREKIKILPTNKKEKVREEEIVKATIVSNDLPKVKVDDVIALIFVSAAGTRYKLEAPIIAVSKNQIIITVGEVEELPERRRSFKVVTKEKATVYSSLTDEEGIEATILNINLGGVLLKSEEKLHVGKIYYLNTLQGSLEIPFTVLRKQKDINNNLVGYGCQFTEVGDAEEEILSKYILDCQIAERERKKTLEDMGLN